MSTFYPASTRPPFVIKVQSLKVYFIFFFFYSENSTQVLMKMPLALVLFCCLVHTAYCLLGVHVPMATEPDDFCDEGPPGRYCLPDLSGWHDCHVDHSTGKMVDTIHSCAPNTR